MIEAQARNPASLIVVIRDLAGEPVPARTESPAIESGDLGQCPDSPPSLNDAPAASLGCGTGMPSPSPAAEGSQGQPAAPAVNTAAPDPVEPSEFVPLHIHSFGPSGRCTVYPRCQARSPLVTAEERRIERLRYELALQALKRGHRD